MSERVSPRTHLGIDGSLCGQLESLEPGRAVVRLRTLPTMGADAQGLVLGSADCRFLAPVRVGAEVVITATVETEKGRKRVVAVEARVGEQAVLSGSLTCFVLDKHVLDAG